MRRCLKATACASSTPTDARNAQRSASWGDVRGTNGNGRPLVSGDDGDRFLVVELQCFVRRDTSGGPPMEYHSARVHNAIGIVSLQVSCTTDAALALLQERADNMR